MAFKQRGFNALRSGLGVIDFGSFASDLNAHRHIRAQHCAPVEFTRSLIKLGKVERHERPDARKNTDCAAQLKIGAPYVAPLSQKRNPPRHNAGVWKPQFYRFCLQQRFKARRADEEDFKGIHFGHPGSLAPNAPGRYLKISHLGHEFAAFCGHDAGMSFAETYSHELLETRRIRSQRARFWAKIVSFALMLTLGATFYSEPQLRQAIMQTGMQGVMSLSGRSAAVPQTSVALPTDLAALQNQLQQDQTGAPQVSTGIKVNRFGPDSSARPVFRKVQPATEAPAAQMAPNQGTDSTAMAQQLGRLLQKLQVGQ